MTPADIANKHITLWYAKQPRDTGHPGTLREHTEDAIKEAIADGTAKMAAVRAALNCGPNDCAEAVARRLYHENAALRQARDDAVAAAHLAVEDLNTLRMVAEAGK